MNHLTFVDDGGIVPLIDDERLDAVLDGEDAWDGVWMPEAQIVARLLQGWKPQELRLDRERTRVIEPPVIRGRGGMNVYAVESLAEVFVTLPGGSHPEVESSDVLHVGGFDGVPVMGCGCGGGVGCDRVLVEITFSRDQVHWSAAEHRFTFARTQYDRAVRTYLGLAGEPPDLITDDEWASPASTRVVDVSRRAR